MKDDKSFLVASDLQALIADCNADIKDLKRSIDRCDAIGTSEYLYELQSKLKRQYLALESLEAKYLALNKEENPWIKWDGGECPIDSAAHVEVKWNNGKLSRGRASNLGWENRIDQGYHSIIAYREVDFNKEYR